jgi:uncharacterized membrane protein YeaQ/YmgE (transglycosylase-associated protein family)
VELLFVVLGGIVVGALAHVVMPWRAFRGVLVGPAVGGIAAAVLWEALTWAGWDYGDTWIWLVALLGAAVVTIAVEWLGGPRRVAADEHFYRTAAKVGADAA